MDANGSIFQLYLYSGDGEMLGVPANQQGAGEGSSYQAAAGEYYLQVNAIGGWKISIVQVARQNGQSGVTTFSGSGGKNTRPFTVDGRWEIALCVKSAGSFVSRTSCRSFSTHPCMTRLAVS